MDTLPSFNTSMPVYITQPPHHYTAQDVLGNIAPMVVPVPAKTDDETSGKG